MTHQFPDSAQYHNLLRLVLPDLLAPLSEILHHCRHLCCEPDLLRHKGFYIFQSVLFANSRRIFPGPQLSKAGFTPQVMWSNRKYWFCSSISSFRTRLKGASRNSKADRSIYCQWGSRLGPVSWRGGGEVGFRDFRVSATGGGSRTVVSLESSIPVSVISILDRACTRPCHPQ